MGPKRFEPQEKEPKDNLWIKAQLKLAKAQIQIVKVNGQKSTTPRSLLTKNLDYLEASPSLPSLGQAKGLNT